MAIHFFTICNSFFYETTIWILKQLVARCTARTLPRPLLCLISPSNETTHIYTRRWHGGQRCHQQSTRTAWDTHAVMLVRRWDTFYKMDLITNMWHCLKRKLYIYMVSWLVSYHLTMHELMAIHTPQYIDGLDKICWWWSYLVFTSLFVRKGTLEETKLT